MMRLKVLGFGAVIAGGLMLATASQAAPALDGTLSAASGADVTPVRFGETYRHHRYRHTHRAYRREHRAYRRAHRAYRAERRYQYGY